MPIGSYRNKKTRSFSEGEFVKEFQNFRQQVEKRLEIIDAATNLGDLAALPSNRLEALTEDRQGQFRIRINQQWRICFTWLNEGPENVEIIDYH